MVNRRTAGIAVAGVLLATAVVSAPTADRHLRAAAMLVRLTDPKNSGNIADYRRHSVSVRSAEFSANGRAVPIRTYTPHGVATPPAMIVLHGVHHLGIEEPRLKAFATTIAESGIQVFTPLLQEIAEYRISSASVEVIGESIKYVKVQKGRPPGVLGLSFAGGLALIAATDERYRDDLSFVVAVGAHHDMERVARFFATGKVEGPAGGKDDAIPNHYGPMILVFSSPQDFFVGKDVQIARTALKRLLETESIEEARTLTLNLSPAGKVMMERVFSADGASLRPGLLAAIQEQSNLMRAASPAGRLHGLRAPVLLIHGSGDDVIPAAETDWLAAEIPSQLLRSKLVTPLLSHVNLDPKSQQAEQWRVVRFMEMMLEQAELQQ